MCMGLSQPDWRTGCEERSLLGKILESSTGCSCTALNSATELSLPLFHNGEQADACCPRLAVPCGSAVSHRSSTRGLCSNAGHRKPEAQYITAAFWAHPKQRCWCGPRGNENLNGKEMVVKHKIPNPPEIKGNPSIGYVQGSSRTKMWPATTID